MERVPNPANLAPELPEKDTSRIAPAATHQVERLADTGEHPVDLLIHPRHSTSAAPQLDSSAAASKIAPPRSGPRSHH
ncbi:MAG TPA: hypothetical protein VMY34_05730 [Acidimicrobiales bacterium]|nr:hypothetical protein [Acidimicrobiales bacterium]